MSDSHKERRAYLGILFECCQVYARIYRKVGESLYKGRCPRCARSLTVQVDPVKGMPVKFLRAR